jgi:hypothetical protein
MKENKVLWILLREMGGGVETKISDKKEKKNHFIY